MGKHGAFQLYHLFLFFILTISLSCKASDEDTKVYIVYMGALQDKLYSPTSHHRSILQSVLEESSVSKSLVRSYNRSFSGFAAKLTEKQRLKLASMKEVISVFPNRILHTQTTRSWDFMGFSETTSRNPTVENDIVVGVIDTGIWPESESFSDEGFGPPPKKWKGACKGGQNFTCNNKIIGARYYATGNSSARDLDGHGSHTASTAAGNNVKHASFYGLKEGTARGGVPSARLAAYNACTGRCSAAAILAAFDDAIADGVDIITISIGFDTAISFDTDPISIGAFHAMEKGILTLNPAGNNGPSLGSVTSVAPWLMTIAASTIDQRAIDNVILGNGTEVIGNAINSFKLNDTTVPLVHGKDASSQCPESYASMCAKGCLDKNLVEGKIVLCDLRGGIDEALAAGALGCITTFDQSSDISSIVPLPASILNSADYTAVLSYLNSTKDPRATILKTEYIKDYTAPNIVASFSSRGPNLITPDILKPDISAPGVSILAAFSPENRPSPIFNDKRRVKYNILSGTSMACPHVAGAAAYVKTFHPHWSPSAIKSSLMTTALLMNNTRNSNGEFDYGSGHVNPAQAINPGLVYEALKGDYIKFLCSIGFDATKVRLVTGDNSSCPKDSNKGSPTDLNYPSMTAEVPPGKSFNIEFHRRVKNVGHANSIYKAQIISGSLTGGIKVVPEVLSFQSLNEEKSFDVIVTGHGLSNNSMVSAWLVWSDGTHNVRSPIVLHNLKGRGT